MGDPEVFWVNVTNIALAMLTIACWVVVLADVGVELRRRFRDRFI